MTKTFEHILVPYNGITRSEKAFRKAVSIAQICQAKITILTCVEERPTFGFFKTKTSKQEIERERKAIEKDHSDLQNYAAGKNVKCSSKIIQSNLASKGILSYANSHEIDLIVLAKTKHYTQAERVYYWSTIENVLKNSKHPLLIM